MTRRHVPSELFPSHDLAIEFIRQALGNLRAAVTVLERERMLANPETLKSERRLNPSFPTKKSPGLLHRKLGELIDKLVEEV